MLKKPFFTLAFLGWLVFITFSSLYSFSGIDTDSFNIPYGDKLVHFTFYFVAAVLGVFFLREQRQWKLTQKKAMGIILVLTIVFGIIIEVIQHTLTVSREGDVFDALANTLGSFCGIFIVNVFFLRMGFMKWESKVL